MRAAASGSSDMRQKSLSSTSLICMHTRIRRSAYPLITLTDPARRMATLIQPHLYV
jgi:hypothetical protein